MSNIDFNIPLASLTLGEFLEILQESGIATISFNNDCHEPKTFISGVKELAQFLNCSVSTAQRKISDHEFDFCLYRSGHILLFDKEKLLEGLQAGKHSVRKFRNK